MQAVTATGKDFIPMTDIDNAAQLKLGYHLNDPERVVRDAVGLVVAKAEAACGVKIMLGRPS